MPEVSGGGATEVTTQPAPAVGRFTGVDVAIGTELVEFATTFPLQLTTVSNPVGLANTSVCSLMLVADSFFFHIFRRGILSNRFWTGDL